jgi:hypothetical protein
MCSRAVIVIALLLLLVPFSTFAAPPGLVLYLPFDGDAKDASGSGNHSVIIGSERYVEGKLGDAMKFDGATYLEVQDITPGTFDGVTELTIEVWVKMSTHHDNGIVVKLTVEEQWWPCIYNLETCSDTLAYFGVNAAAGGYATSPYPLDEWFHLTGVFDNGELLLYVNGELASSASDPSNVLPDSDLPVYIGCVDPNDFFFVGELDDIAIYRRALTEEEIQQDMGSISPASVESADKLTSTWATIKVQR